MPRTVAAEAKVKVTGALIVADPELAGVPAAAKLTALLDVPEIWVVSSDALAVVGDPPARPIHHAAGRVGEAPPKAQSSIALRAQGSAGMA
jgi:hypothetical protein